MGRLARSQVVATAAVVLIGFTAAPALAQPVVDPTKTEFSPSVDHGATFADGRPVLDRYDLELYVSGNTQPFQRLSVGKPAPDPDGLIRVNFASLSINWPSSTGVYVVDIVAVGAGGAGRSGLSNTFTFSLPAPPPAPPPPPPTCTYAVSPASQTAIAKAGTYRVGVTAGAGCAWTAASGATWIAITSGSSGTGNGTVTYTVATNKVQAVRTGTLTAAGKSVVVTQDARTPPGNPKNLRIVQ